MAKRRALIAIFGAAIVLALMFIFAFAYKAWAGTDTILAGGGDIASSSTGPALKTANVVKGILADNPNAAAVTLGDMAYPDGTGSDFKNKYTPTWGQFKSRTYPVVGNHEYYCCGTGKPSAAKNYFATGAAHDLSSTYYSVDLNPTLKFIALDANKTESGKATGAPDCITEKNWLVTQLQAAQANGQDTVLAWHESRYSNGTSHHSDTTGCPALFATAAYQYGGDVVITGHSHNYENFGYMDDANHPVAAGAGPYFIVTGTGGANYDGFTSTMYTPYQKRFQLHGVLELHQDADGAGFTFQFDATDGTHPDSGIIVSH